MMALLEAIAPTTPSAQGPQRSFKQGQTIPGLSKQLDVQLGLEFKQYTLSRHNRQHHFLNCLISQWTLWLLSLIGQCCPAVGLVKSFGRSQPILRRSLRLAPKSWEDRKLQFGVGHRP
jgi:hypothetical protein